MLALQRSAGNRATTRVLQRQPAPQPHATDDSLEAALDAEQDLLLTVGLAQQEHYTQWRDGFLRDARRELDPVYNRLVELQAEGKTPAPGEVQRFWDQLEEYREQWNLEHSAGAEAWEEVRKQYEAEVQRLKGEADFASMGAAELLTREFEQAGRYVKVVRDGLVSEDFASLTLMMAKGTHIKEGGRRAEKAQQVFEADLAQYEADEAASLVNLADDDSVLKTAWQIFGWDSVGEFAADVGLTIITFGLAKWIRAGAKAAKARRRAQRIKELRALLTARRAERAKKKVSRGLEMVRLLRGGARDAFREQLKWLKENWTKVGRKVGTDVAAGVLQGKNPKLASTATRRAAKEYINASVMQMLGKDEKYEKRLLRLAWAAQFAGKDEKARKLTHVYLLLNIRRRLLVNTIYYGSVEAGKLELDLQNLPLRKIAVATVGECVQDMITAVPVFDLPGVKDVIETARKYIAKEVEGLVT